MLHITTTDVLECLLRIATDETERRVVEDLDRNPDGVAWRMVNEIREDADVL